MNYELAAKLKEAGFPQRKGEFYYRLGYHTSEAFDNGVSLGKKGIISDKFYRVHSPYPRCTTADVKWNQADLMILDEAEVACPTLGELVNECASFSYGVTLQETGDGGWLGFFYGKNTYIGRGQTPEEAMANFWLEIQKEVRPTPPKQN